MEARAREGWGEGGFAEAGVGSDPGEDSMGRAGSRPPASANPLPEVPFPVEGSRARIPPRPDPSNPPWVPGTFSESANTVK